MGRLWTGVYAYLGGLDYVTPIPTEGKSETFTKHARSIERNLENIQRVKGDRQRRNNVKG